MQHGLMPGNKVKYKNSIGEVIGRGAEKGKGYYVEVKFKTMLSTRKEKFWNDDILSLRKV